MMIKAIFVFVFIALGFGSITYIAGWSKEEDALERIVLSLGAGLLFIPLMGAACNVLSIPLDYRVFLAAAAAMFTASAIHCRKHRKAGGFAVGLKDVVTPVNIAVIVLFAASLYMYLRGSFAYPWFESEDPWLFASASKYIAVQKTYTAPFKFCDVAQPYPQGYQIIMGLLSQTGSGINWTMKFFNGLFVSLSVPFFFYLAKRFIANRWAALLATVLLFSMPAWLTHFIFSLNLSMVFLPLFFYMLLKSEADARWRPVAALAFASIWMVHFYSSVIITIFFLIYYGVTVFCEGKAHGNILKTAAAGFAAAIALFWLPSLLRFREAVFTENKGSGGLDIVIPMLRSAIGNRHALLLAGLCLFSCFLLRILWKHNGWKFLQGPARQRYAEYVKPAVFISGLAVITAFLILPDRKIVPLIGSASMPYTFDHFSLLNPEGNFIQNPFGIGLPAIIFAVMTVFYAASHLRTLFTKEKTRLAIALTWSIFAFLGVMGARFSINIVPFRMWSFLAFSIALSGALVYNELSRDMRYRYVPIAGGILLTALSLTFWHANKFALNTRPWKDGYIGIAEGRQLYAWIKDALPKDSAVYVFASDQCVPIVFDMLSFAWDKEVFDYAAVDIERSIEENHAFLKKKGYEYIALDGSSVLFAFNRLREDLPEKMKRAFLVIHMKRLEDKIKAVKAAPSLFEPVREITGYGAVFKIN
ncbi:MAG: hypothetical protein PHT32_03540 [Candidatus Omnitrophica bacterium]|nr:hypothetical protein [Candidatus Omnitrophota bacterium]